MKSIMQINGEEIVAYAVENDLGWHMQDVEWSELSSGNINYIYRITNKDSKKSVILKFADNATRVRPDGFLSQDRNLHEACVLQWYGEAAAGFVPRIVSINKEKHYFLMEDINSCKTLRSALMEGVMPSRLGFEMARFIVNTTFPLLELVSDKPLTDRPCVLTYSKDLIKITGELVFTAPYYDVKNKNVYIEENVEYLRKNVCNNKKLALIAAKLKEKFKTYKQSLIHGDLHSSSILLRFDGNKEIGKISTSFSMFVIDPEFAFYGPIAYDVGNFLAHLMFAKAYCMFMEEDGQKKAFIENYYLQQEKSFCESFINLAVRFLNDNVYDPLYKNEDFIKSYVEDIIKNSFLYAGTEIIRRIVGSAKVDELESLKDIEIRVAIERYLVEVATEYMLDIN